MVSLHLVVKASDLESIPARVEVKVLDSLKPPAAPGPVVRHQTGCGCNAGAEGVSPLIGLVLLVLNARRRRR